MEGYVHHNYDFLMEHMAADYFDHSPCAARNNQECVNILKNTEKTFTDMEVNILDVIKQKKESVLKHWRFSNGKWLNCRILSVLARYEHQRIAYLAGHYAQN